MTSFIERQADAFADAVMDAHYEASAVWNVVDAVTVATTVVGVIVSRAKATFADGPPADGQRIRAVVQKLYSAYGHAFELLELARENGHPIDLADMTIWRKTLVSLRDCLACLDAVTAEHAEDPSLPSLADLERQVAARSATSLAEAEANAMRLIGRPRA